MPDDDAVLIKETIMQIDIAVRHLGHHAITRAFARQRLEHALGRFTDQIGHVWMRLDCLAAHHGDSDKTCRIQIHFAQGGECSVESRHEHLPGAITHCLESTLKTVRRELQRRRTDRHRRRAA
jgi:hypothetical protein